MHNSTNDRTALHHCCLPLARLPHFLWYCQRCTTANTQLPTVTVAPTVAK